MDSRPEGLCDHVKEHSTLSNAETWSQVAEEVVHCRSVILKFCLWLAKLGNVYMYMWEERERVCISGMTIQIHYSVFFLYSEIETSYLYWCLSFR